MTTSTHSRTDLPPSSACPSRATSRSRLISRSRSIPRTRFIPRMRAGFTLIEMITVLTIIIIVLAIAVPVWHALMGGTNLVVAQNQISAFLAGARADAVYNKQTIGVCFFIDQKTQQTAMAEVQVQNLYQPHPYASPPPSSINPPPATSPIYTSLFQPCYWGANMTGTPFPPSTSPPPGTTNDNGPVYSIEMVNYPDPNNPGHFIFYRDVTLLPKGVAVALNNNTYLYNQLNLWNYGPPGSAYYPAIDRYTRFGIIMFGPDGTLATIPYAVPYYECLTQAQYSNGLMGTYPPENQLCARIGMYGNPPNDLASNLYPPNPPPTGSPTSMPLKSSVGFMVYDQDVYLSQHATPRQVWDNTNYPTPPTVQDTVGDSSQFTASDMNVPINGSTTNYTTAAPFAQDKYIEESWIDQNGSAYLINPANGSLIKAR